jgi:hypothetical protein
MGYKNLRSYLGGLQGWIESGGPVERGAEGAKAGGTGGARASGRRGAAVERRRPGRKVVALIDALASRSVGELLAAWLGMVLAFAALYWIAGAGRWGGLEAGGRAIASPWDRLATAVYFSFITATSVGYGDVVPTGVLRVLAIAEAAAGLLVFGFVISKFVSRRQELVTEEIHRIAFEGRVGRVQTNLLVVLSEIQAISTACAERNVPVPKGLARAEGATGVFAAELRTIHDLLYRPQQVPDEQVLESILASLASALRELLDFLTGLPNGTELSTILRGNLGSISGLASGICGECVPGAYAPVLKERMDRIQEMARQLSA